VCVCVLVAGGDCTSSSPFFTLLLPLPRKTLNREAVGGIFAVDGGGEGTDGGGGRRQGASKRRRRRADYKE
jgi:hypothetical protein